MLSGDGATLVVGVPVETHSPDGYGSVNIYTYQGSDWALAHQFTEHPNPNANWQYNRGLGKHVAVSTDGAVVAFSTTVYSNQKEACVQMYQHDGASWNSLYVDQGASSSTNDPFGAQVPMSADGSKLAVVASAGAVQVVPVAGAAMAGYARTFSVAGDVWNISLSHAGLVLAVEHQNQLQVFRYSETQQGWSESHDTVVSGGTHDLFKHVAFGSDTIRSLAMSGNGASVALVSSPSAKK